MSLAGVDSDDESVAERSEYVQARRYMDYEIKGEANPEEVEWLHAHPVEWLRALKSAKRETQMHLARDHVSLRSHPAKPTGAASAEDHDEWASVRAEFAKRQTGRHTFLAKISDREQAVRSLIGDELLARSTLVRVVARLLDAESLIAVGEYEEARRRIAHTALSLAKEVNL